jgi:hypothetical protein
MRPRRTVDSTNVFRLEGGNEDNDLWVARGTSEQGDVILSVWEPTHEERAQIAAGGNVELVVWGIGHPPVAIHVTDVALGKP